MSIIKELKTKIEELQLQIKSIQSECSHPRSACKVVPKSGSMDGYSIDNYWNEIDCGLCDYHWREEQ